MFKPVHCEARTVGKGVVDMHLKCRPVTVHNSSCRQVMFLHLSVIPFMGWGVHGRWHVWHGGWHTWQRGHVWQRACMARVACVVGGAYVHGRRDGHCSGRYAPCCNAFLLLSVSIYKIYSS